MTPTDTALAEQANPHGFGWAVVSLRETDGYRRVSLASSRNAAVKMSRTLRASGYVARVWRLADPTWLTLGQASTANGEEE